MSRPKEIIRKLEKTVIIVAEQMGKKAEATTNEVNALASVVMGLSRIVKAYKKDKKGFKRDPKNGLAGYHEMLQGGNNQ